MKPLTIEIHGTGTHNRGAELMAIAIADRMRCEFPGLRLVVQPLFGDFHARSRHGFLTTWEIPGKFRSKIVKRVIRHSTSELRATLGIINPAEVDFVLDASGFAFSDQWGTAPAKELIRKMTCSYRLNQGLILMPQALGPFESPEMAASARKLFARAEFVCARDNESYTSAETLCSAGRLFRYPDFTIGVKPIPPSGKILPERMAAIVPNYRMMDMMETGATYIKFLVHVISMLRRHGFNPVFILHDSEEDKKILDHFEISDAIPVLSDPDPRVLKGILGKAEIVIGSRFHALVSALSQGVPCIGAGWSHKYHELFRDFNCKDFHIEDLGDLVRIEGVIATVADSTKRSAIKALISEASFDLKYQTEEMWKQVTGVIRNKVHTLQ